VLCDLFLATAIVACGVGVAQMEEGYFPREHVGNFAGEERRLARVEVEIISAPRVLRVEGDHRPIPARQVMQGEVVRVLTVEGWKESCGKVLVQIGEPRGDLQIRQRIEVLGMLERPEPAMNPGQFDWAEYYREQRILASIEAAHGGNVTVLDSPGPGVLDVLRAKARGALEAGFSDEHRLDHALLRALVLGDSDPMLRDVQDEFQRTGTSHHLAISGMHVAVVGLIVYWLLRWLMLHPRTATSIAIAVIVLYGVIALPSTPVIRSVVFCATFGIGAMRARSLDGVHLVALGAFGILIWQPLDLYNAGFQLSFLTTLGLMVLTPPLLRWRYEKFKDLDMEIAWRAQQQPGWRRRLREWKFKLWEAVGCCLIASIVSAPLIAIHFNQFSWWGVVATFVLIPFVFLALVLGLLKLIVSLIIPPAAPLLAVIAGWSVMVMRTIVGWFASLPGNDMPMPMQSVWLVLAYYMLLLAFLVPVQRPWIRRSLKTLMAAGMAVLLFLPLVIAPAVVRDGEARLTMLSVEAGQCAVMRLPSGKVVLIDAGSQGMELWRRCVGPFLKSQGIGSVNEIYLSHANYDHYSAAADAVRMAGVERVLVGPMFGPQVREHVAGRHLLEVVGDRLNVIGAGEAIELDEQTKLEVLWPSVGNGGLAANDTSLVLRMTVRGRRILFTGDIQEAGMRALLRTPQVLKCDVLVAPHHGSSELATAEFLKACGAEVVLASNDNTLTQKQKAFEKLVGERPLYRTNRCGAVTVKIDAGGGMRCETFLKAKSVKP
jgi:competence protein ComEC